MLLGTGITSTVTVGTSAVINNGLTLGANTTFAVGFGTLQINGGISGAFSLTVANAPNATLRIEVTGSGVNGPEGFVVTSAGNAIRGLALFNLRVAIRIAGTGAHDNVVAGETSWSGFYHTTGSLSYYKPNWGRGNHEIKTGFDYGYGSTEVWGLTEKDFNYHLRFASGVPDSIAFFNAPITPHRDMRLFGAYVKDNWTMVTADGKPAAHFEHTVAVTDVGVDVLTDGRQPFTL